MKPTSPIKPWHRLGISKKGYLKARPWKNAGMSRQKLESIIMAAPQELLDDMRLESEADMLVEAIFGEGEEEE